MAWRRRPLRWTVAIALLAVGVVASLALTVVTGLPFVFLPLFFPFMFRISGRRARDRGASVCPECGRDGQTAEDRYCPRDGVALREPGQRP